ncbi:MAG: sugar phosphate isomerase/epimerase [Rhodothermia bacterium]|nr:MAG: sugar phosphate isomerase/epimerase [Rhodothermia bacterium]
MSLNPLNSIRIGTLVDATISDPADYIAQILPHGFESFQLTFGSAVNDIDLPALADRVLAVLEGSNAVISSLGVYGNPILDSEDALQTRESWSQLIRHADAFGARVIGGFTGRLTDRSIPESISKFAEVFAPIVDQAGEKGLTIGFENCSMGGDWSTGDWNIAHGPDAWELMFEALPDDHVGLEWEPCHQMINLIDPLPQLRTWVGRIKHIHGKCASVHMDTVRETGVRGSKQFAYHRTPGFGDTDWTDVFSELRAGGFKGSVDIEGWHDPVYRDELEMSGQVFALNYLKRCRGGVFIPNPYG